MNVVWLRNDLRTLDNPALYHACQAGPTLVVAIVTPGQWREHDDAAAKVGLWLSRLAVVAKELLSLNIPFKLLHLDRYCDAPNALVDLCSEHDAATLWYNHEYPLNEQRRDQAVNELCQSKSIAVNAYHGDVVMAPGSVLTQSNDIYKVFTPFSRAWRKQLTENDLKVLPVPRKQKSMAVYSDEVPSTLSGWDLSFREDLWPVETSVIHKRLDTFVAKRAAAYQEHRDYPAINGTSILSPYLAIGALSVRQCLYALRQKHEDALETTWATELIWREFYRHLIAAFPHLSRSENFKPTYRAIRWESDDSVFKAWCQGQTGYPIVDAAMKQLVSTGWMHNRLRMVTASFLTKLLMVDWRKGEAFFMQHLVDGDYASNNGGWQWAASTGADAVPDFRIFNPYNQSQKFDASGQFIRKFLPELKGLTDKDIHQPSVSQCEACSYPKPIVDYKFARERAKDRFDAAMKK